jgi:hypothetical protein
VRKLLGGELISLLHIKICLLEEEHSIASLFLMFPEEKVKGHIFSVFDTFFLDILHEIPKG